MGRGRVFWTLFSACVVAGLFVAQPGLAAQGDCSQPVSSGDGPLATDCLFILRAAVGSEVCATPCVCDPSGDENITATDALRCLFVAVGTPGITMDCNCGMTTTTTTIAQGCTGASSAGACWFLADPMTSCDTLCEGLALSCDEVAIRDIAGSGGTNEACGVIVDMLSPETAPHPRVEFDRTSCGADLGVGCERFVDRFGTVQALRGTGPVTTCAADGENTSCFSSGARVCACD
jgi:hypothetical protein